jgi:hypothetical protein
MYAHFASQTIAVVAPRSLASLPTGIESPLIMPVVCLLAALLLLVLRPRRRGEPELDPMLSQLRDRVSLERKGLP